MDEGLQGLSEAALRARHAANLARIEELRAVPERTIVEAREMRNLATESNEIAEYVTEMTQTLELAGLAEPAAPVVAVEVPAAPTATLITNVDVVAGEEVALAEAIAAAAEVGNEVGQTGRVTRVGDRLVTPGSPVVEQRRGKSIQASSSHGGITVGSEVTLLEIGSMAQAIAMDKGRVGSNQSLVTVLSDRPNALRADASAAHNTQALAQYLRGEGDSITAAPFEPCGPPDILRDVPECLNTEDYVSSWFRTIPSEHGAIQFYRPLGMADVANGTVVWGQTEQDAIVESDSATWKPCATIGCLPTITVGVEEIVQCLCMPVFNHMTSPEVVGSAMAAMRAVLARTRDGHLLEIYDELSSQYTYDAAAQNPLGATIDIYDLLGRLLGMTAASNRQLDLSSYTLAVEAGFIAHLSLDNQMACNPRLASEAATALFGGLGIGNIVVTPDWALVDGGGPWTPLLPINPPGSAAIPVPPRPTDWKLRLFSPDDFGMLSPGTEELGIVPDLASKRQNKLCWFGATYQGLAKLGCRPSFSIEITNLEATGARSACVPV